MRLIDAERMPNDEFFDGLSDIEKAKVIQWMISAPTVDAVEVVRCADCKYRDTDGCYMSFYDDTGEVITLAEDNDYCSKGERRAE